MKNYLVTKKEKRFHSTAKGRAWHRRLRWSEFGIDPTFTVADYEKLLAAQGGVCALCGELPASKRLGVDHDHARQHQVGNVRGLVCRRCNNKIGRVEAGHNIYKALRDRVQAYLTPRGSN